MKKIFILTIAVLSLVLNLNVLADMFTPSHSCSKPFKPYQFNSQYEIDAFMDDVSLYRSCIEDFVDEQRSQAKKHLDAADDAIDDWNRFVRFELN